MEFEKMKRSIKRKVGKSSFLHPKDNKTTESTQTLNNRSPSPDCSSLASSADFPYCALQESKWTLLTLADEPDIDNSKGSDNWRDSIDSSHTHTQKTSDSMTCSNTAESSHIPLPRKKKHDHSESNDISTEISSQIYWPNRDSARSSQFTTLTKSQIYDMEHTDNSEPLFRNRRGFDNLLSPSARTSTAPLAVQERTSLTSSSPHASAVVPEAWSKFDDVDDTSRKFHQGHQKAVSASPSPMTSGTSFLEDCGKPRTSPPQLPPRRKAHTPVDHSCQNSDNTRIYPIMVDGKQISHTHYWLIPAPKHRRHRSEDNKEGTNQRRLSGEYCNIPSNKPSQPDFHGLREPHTHEGTDFKRHSSHIPRIPPPLPILPDKPWSVDKNQKYHGSTSSPNPIPTPPKASSTDVEAQHLQSMVTNSTLSEAKEALSASHHHLPTAITLLQIEQLHKLRLSGVSREICRTYLEQHNWNVERAAAALVDTYCGGAQSNTSHEPHSAQ